MQSALLGMVWTTLIALPEHRYVPPKHPDVLPEHPIAHPKHLVGRMAIIMMTLIISSLMTITRTVERSEKSWKNLQKLRCRKLPQQVLPMNFLSRKRREPAHCMQIVGQP